jgi:hypothetical protein
MWECTLVYIVLSRGAWEEEGLVVGVEMERVGAATD